MAEFSKLIITDQGKSLVMKAIENEIAIRFTKIVASSHMYSMDELKSLTSLENVWQENIISEISRENTNTIKIKAVLPNTDLTEGYYLKAVGIYASDPDEEEILYGVAIETSEGGCYIPAYNNQTVSNVYFNLSVAVGNSENVLLEVDQGAIVTVEQLDKKVENMQSKITGAATTITSNNLTASRALTSNSSGKVAVSATTSTELGYIHGVTSAIQTQLNGKMATTNARNYVTFPSGVKDSGACPIMKIGNIVHVNLVLYFSENAATNKVVATIPSGFYPTGKINNIACIYISSEGTVGYKTITINTTGTITVDDYIYSGSRIYVNITYYSA